MTEAEEFVRQNIDVYGLLGLNNRVIGDMPRRQLPGVSHEYTDRNHFVFGFDADAFSNRLSGAAIYWTEYGPPIRPHKGFKTELLATIHAVHKAHGPISITASGSYISSGLIAAAKEAGIGFRQVVVGIDEYKLPEYDVDIETTIRTISFKDFTEFAMKFAAATGCQDAWIALEAYHGVISDLPHIFDGCDIRIFNSNYDEQRKSIVGPSNWNLVDNEKFTAIQRGLILTGKLGFPQFLRQTPELIASQLDSQVWRDWLRKASAPDATPSFSVWCNQNARVRLMKDAFPGLQMAYDARRGRGDPEFDRQMRILSRKMRRSNPGCSRRHMIPLNRFASSMGVKYDFSIGEPERVYGFVHQPEPAVQGDAVRAVA